MHPGKSLFQLKLSAAQYHVKPMIDIVANHVLQGQERRLRPIDHRQVVYTERILELREFIQII